MSSPVTKEDTRRRIERRRCVSPPKMCLHRGMDEGGTPVQGVWYKLVFTPTASWLFSLHPGAFATPICRSQTYHLFFRSSTQPFGNEAPAGAYKSYSRNLIRC